jgi:RNA polymerase sigma-70 factor (ECF subfamily)
MSEANEDARWVVKCLRGDAEAFNPLVRKYQRTLFTVARRLVGDHEDALDVTQNVFVRAYEKLDTYDPKRRFFSWIYRIAVNESLNLRRARKSSEPLKDTVAAKGGAADAAEASERRAGIDAALGRLTMEYREVIVMRYFAELSYEEIGEALGIPEKTVKSRLFSAKERLAVLLAATEGTMHD